jgi:hypothetical protein
MCKNEDDCCVDEQRVHFGLDVLHHILKPVETTKHHSKPPHQTSHRSQLALNYTNI